MLILFLVIVFVTSLAIVFSEDVSDAISNRRRAKAIAKRGLVPGENLSSPAQEIFKEYNSLPETNKPYANMEYVLSALDVKHEKQKVNKHFSQFNGWDDVFTWDCSCQVDALAKASCPFKEYSDFYKDIKAIYSELKEQEHALQISGIQDGLDQIAEIRAALKQEQQLIKRTTKELTK